MPVLPNTADLLTRKLPKLVPVRAHRAADYALGVSFALAGVWFWRRNRPAAVASWISAGTILGLAKLTSYPDQPKGLVDFGLHGKLEVALAALIATMPEFFSIDGNRPRKYFRAKAAILTILSNLSSFSPPRSK